jgi:hypothetical protein
MAWEAAVLALNYARTAMRIFLRAFADCRERANDGPIPAPASIPPPTVHGPLRPIKLVVEAEANDVVGDAMIIRERQRH